MESYIYELQLYHHGIKGQKWGIRRFQKKDGTLTSAGKKRYSDDKSTKQTRYDKLYAKYKTLGYSDKEAAASAKGRIATERTLAVIGGVAVTAVAAYGTYRYLDNTKDRFISPDTVMQTVHKGDISDRIKPGNPFYATYTKKDNTIYASKVFSHFTDKSNITRFYTKDGIKVASEKTSRDIFKSLESSDPEIRDYVSRLTKRTSPAERYKIFNWSLVMRNDSDTRVAKTMQTLGYDHDKIHKKFYDELKKRGYGGIIDVNDSKREGFTFNPVIVFDDQIKHVVGTTKATKEHLSPERTIKGLKYAHQRKFVLNPLSNPAVAASGLAFLNSIGINAKDNKDLNKRVKFVENYIKEHPNTKLSNAQIAELYTT